MAPRSIRRALGAVKDQTSISLAKVGNSDTLADIDVAIVKATRHEEYPADERHFRELLSLTSCSRIYVSACVNTLARRLNKTRNWVVALKTLILIQRLLSDGDPAFEQEIFFATRCGTRFLNMSDFRDNKSNSWDSSAFVRTYALYLDERLEYKMQGKRGRRSAFSAEDDDNEKRDQARVKSAAIRDMKTEKVFSRMQHLQQLLDRFLACRPTGEAKQNRVVIVALYPIVKESFTLYYEITEILGILVERFMELEISGSVKVFEIFSRVSKQFEELDSFYAWSKAMGVARSSEYPEVEKITHTKLEMMEDFIRDKSALAQIKSIEYPEKTEPEQEVAEPEEVQEDMNSIKALPAPEGFEEAPAEEAKEEEPKEEQKEVFKVQEDADFLHLGDDALSSEEHANRLAVALFDGAAPARPSAAPAWKAFNDDTTDWETALVQSASNLSSHEAALPGGFDKLLLDGMYQQGAIKQSIVAAGYGVSGSASSVALGSAGRPAILALPAPPTAEGSGAPTSSDPFSASVAIAPPPFVQMSDLEKKQKLLMEEQLMWQQYARDGRQGAMAVSGIRPNNHNTGGYA